MLNYKSEVEISKEIIGKHKLDLEQKNKELSLASENFRALTNKYTSLLSRS